MNRCNLEFPRNCFLKPNSSNLNIGIKIKIRMKIRIHIMTNELYRYEISDERGRRWKIGSAREAHNRSSQVKVPDLAIYPLTAYAVLETLDAFRAADIPPCPLT